MEKLTVINEDFIRPKNQSRHAELNSVFYLALADLSGNPLTKILMSSIMDLVFSYPGPIISAAFIEKANADHENIVQAICKRDKPLAERLLLQNIDLVANEAL